MSNFTPVQKIPSSKSKRKLSDSFEKIDRQKSKKFKTVPLTESNGQRKENESLNIKNIWDLKAQLINQIFQYLDVKERKTASLVCKAWLELLSEEDFAKECPLTFNNVKVVKRHLPLTVFRHKKQFRTFPFVHIGNVSYEIEDEYLKMFKKIGTNTTHLRISGDCYPSILTCFPSLTSLHLRHMKDILNFNNLPPKLENLIVDELYVMLDVEVYQKLQELTNLREVRCETFYLHIPREFVSVDDDVQEHVQVFGITAALFNAVDECQSFVSKIKINSNLIEKPTVDCDDVTAVYLKTGTKFNSIHQFVNLKEIFMCTGDDSRYSDENKDYCFNYHEVQSMNYVETLYLRNCSLKGLCPSCYSTILESLPKLNHLLVETHVFGAEKMNELITKFPKLKVLQLQCNLLNPDFIYPPENPETPWLGSFTNLEELEFPFGWFEEKMLATMPPLPNLKKLNLSYFKRTSNNFGQSLTDLTKQYPHITNFTIGEDDFDVVDLLPIVKGWPGLKYLNILISGSGFNPTATKTIAKFCKKLKRLSFNADPNLFPTNLLDWQLQLYREIPMLEKIEAHDLEGDSWGSSTREIFYNRPTVPKALTGQSSAASLSSTSTYRSDLSEDSVENLVQNLFQ